MADIEDVKKKVLEAAEGKRTSAGMNGSWGDGGASVLEIQVQFYEYGQKGAMPPEWAKYAEQLDKSSNPRYKLYQELKQEFEGKSE